MKNYKNFITISLLYFLVTATVYFYHIGGDYYDYISNALYLIAPIVAVYFCYRLIKTFGSKIFDKKPTNFLFFGLSLWLVGEIFFIYSDLTGVLTYPSVADALYLLAYPLFMIAIFMELKTIGIQGNKIFQISLVGILFFIIYIIFRFYYHGDYSSENSLVENIFNSLYVIGDGIIVFMGILLIYLLYSIKNGIIFKPWLYILIGLILNTIADTLLTTYSSLYITKEQDLVNLDLIWIISYLAITFGFVLYINAIRKTQSEISLKMKLGTYAT